MGELGVGDMAKAVYDSDEDGRIEKDALEFASDKLLKGAGAGSDPTEIDAYDPEAILDIIDDFVSGANTDGQVGSLGWSIGGTVGSGDSPQNHPGQYALQTTATIGNRSYLVLQPPTTRKVIRYQDEWEITFIVQIPLAASIENVRVFAGVIANVNAEPGDQDRAGFEFDTSVNGGDTNWMLCTGEGAASTRVDSGIAMAGMTWYKLKVKKLATNYEFYIDGVLKGTLSTNLPNTDMNIGMSLETLAEAIKYFRIDFFRWKQAGITR